MSRQLNIALIGAGYAGQSHAFGYRNARMDDALGDLQLTLHTVCDPNRELAQQVAAKYGFQYVVADVDEVISNPEIDAVSIALPNRLYVDLVPKVVKAGKHVFCEKPLGLDAEEAQIISRAAEEAGVVNAVGFSFRRIPALAALAQVVQDGVLGDVEWFRAFYYADYAADPHQPRTWRYVQNQSGGGALADIGAHTLDTVRYVVGDITEVTSAQLSTVITDRPMPAGGIGHSQKASETERGAVENDDISNLSVRTASGAIGNVTLSRIACGTPNDLGIEVYGTKGHARFSSAQMDQLVLFEDGVSAPGMDGARIIVAGPGFPYFGTTAAMPGRGVGTGYGEAFMAEIQEFVKAVVNGTPTTNPFSDAVPTMKVISAAQKSAAEGHPVAVN
jgi:predicted dehydrogenase